MSKEKITIVQIGPKDEARFWAKVQRAEGEACWLWTGAKTALGYGRFKIRGKVYYAHRVAFVLQWGDSPDYVVCHRQDGRRSRGAAGTEPLACTEG
jgi:hypothetical protein